MAAALAIQHRAIHVQNFYLVILVHGLFSNPWNEELIKGP
jgi:hypothetical protein